MVLDGTASIPKLSTTLPRADTERVSAVLEKKSRAVRAAVDSHLAEVAARRRNFFNEGDASVTAAWTATGARNAWI